MADSLPESMPELLSLVETEWKLLWRIVDQLTPEQLVTPDAGGWSPKDNLAHLSEWMKALMGYHMDRRPAHVVMNLPIEITKDWDMDVINPALFARNRDRSAEDVLAELKSVYAGLTLKLRSMPFEELMKPRHADDPERQPVLVWVLGDTADHFAEHRQTIEKLL
jgi:hypothetical protein